MGRYTLTCSRKDAFLFSICPIRILRVFANNNWNPNLGLIRVLKKGRTMGSHPERKKNLLPFGIFPKGGGGHVQGWRSLIIGQGPSRRLFRLLAAGQWEGSKGKCQPWLAHRPVQSSAVQAGCDTIHSLDWVVLLGPGCCRLDLTENKLIYISFS